MVSLPLVLGIAAVAALPAVAYVMTNEYHGLETEGCGEQPTHALATSSARRMSVRIENVAESADVRLCVFEGRGGPERYEAEVSLAAHSTHTFDVWLSESADRLVLELDRPGYEYTEPVYAIIGSSSSIPDCGDGVPQLVFRTEFYGNGNGIHGQKPSCGH